MKGKAVKMCNVYVVSSRVAYHSFTWLKITLQDDWRHMARNVHDDNNMTSIPTVTVIFQTLFNETDILEIK